MLSRLKSLLTFTAVLLALASAARRRAASAAEDTAPTPIGRRWWRSTAALATTSGILAIAVAVSMTGSDPAAARPRPAPAFRLAAASDTSIPPIDVALLAPPPPPTTTTTAPPPDPNQLVWPAHGPIWSPFGRRPGEFHQGDDIGAPPGSVIVAAQSGVVTAAGSQQGYGLTTQIDHGGGLSTLYAHQAKLLVAVGQHVTQGQPIGIVGATGRVTAPHLHFEVHVNGKAQDPMRWLRNAKR